MKFLWLAYVTVYETYTFYFLNKHKYTLCHILVCFRNLFILYMQSYRQCNTLIWDMGKPLCDPINSMLYMTKISSRKTFAVRVEIYSYLCVNICSM